MTVRLMGLLAGALLLAGCTNDGASYKIDGREHTLSLMREQTRFWEQTAEFEVVTARLPECQRRHKLGVMPLASIIEVWQPGNNTFVLRQDGRMVLVETRTCEGFQILQSEPPGGMGSLRGRFRDDGNGLQFVAAP